MILTFTLAIIMGLSLGLLGGGGSILTVPILVYGMNFPPKVSIALSLAIVAVTSLFGVWGQYKKKNVILSVFVLFAPTAMLGTFAGAKISQFMSGNTQLILFAVIMFIASFFMLKPRQENQRTEKSKNRKKYFYIAAEGLFVGIVTGLVGVGGGFLIVPALVLLSNLTMHQAIGTSLLIISVKSFAGFIGYIGLIEVPWEFLAKFIAFSSIGVVIGSYLSNMIPQDKLKRYFGVFLIFMAIYILYKNIN